MSGTRERGRGPLGVLLIDKPAGPTSHDVVGWVRWALRERAVGHCGTLDPPASGLLVVCVGAATKLVEHLTGVDKRYQARLVLGRSTTTADAEGETIATAEVPPDIEAAARAALAGLVGELELPPPAVSAVRVDGRRAHEMVRAGDMPQLDPRPMGVRELSIEGLGREAATLWIDVEVHVTKGTYIRSLAEELGRRLGLPAHLARLRRSACGQLSVEDPLTVGQLTPVLLPPDPARPDRPPKWRLEPAALGDPKLDARARANGLLAARMSWAWQRLPFEIGVVSGPGAHAKLLERLVQGQRLRADADTLSALGLSLDSGTCAVVDRAGGHMIVLRRESGRLAPARVLRFDPEHPLHRH